MKSNTKLMLAAAAMTGLLAGSARLASAAVPPSANGTTVKATSVEKVAGVKAIGFADEPAAGKHDCKGKNACKGQGGCKSGDNECKGKNSCKGKGGCNTNKPADAPKF